MAAFLAVITTLAVFAAVAAVTWYLLEKQHQDLYVWPSITRCPLCEKRVYVWQAHEYRDFRVKIDNPAGLPDEFLPAISVSGIVHQACVGTPETTVTVQRRISIRP